MEQLIIPMLAYENGVQAIEWLCRAFGFSKKEEWIDDDGRLSHGEIEIHGQTIMLATPSKDYMCPVRLKAINAETNAMFNTPYIINGTLVYVHNVDHHFEVAKHHGAIILSEVEDAEPGRRYRVEDLEGQRWMFMERRI